MGRVEVIHIVAGLVYHNVCLLVGVHDAIPLIFTSFIATGFASLIIMFLGKTNCRVLLGSSILSHNPKSFPMPAPPHRLRYVLPLSVVLISKP